MSDSAIALTEVTKRYQERLVLDRISVTLPPGQTVALIGPSGGGKSTLLRCINGLNTFDSGAISVGPHRLQASSSPRTNAAVVPHIRQLYGMIFQDFQLFPHRTALGNVIEAPMQVLGLARQEASERGMKLLQRVGLENHAHAWPQQLSGGQKQRVAIARALAMQPRGLLCDEITSALDPELKHEVLRVLEDLRGEGLTLIMVTHEIGFARRAADRVLLLANGTIIEDGPAVEVLDKPQTERGRVFLRNVLG